MMLVTRGGHESFSPLQLNPIRSLVEDLSNPYSEIA